MNEKLEIAKKLAKITGKPLSDFYSGEIEDEVISEKVQIETRITDDALQIETVKQKSTPKEETTPTPELLKYRDIFKDSKIVRGRILYGRTMTRKEYLKYTKSIKSEQDYFTHPLMYKLFRAEGQTDANFLTFSDRFKNESKK